MRTNDDLELHAFVDGELSPDQQAEMLEPMRSDPELARQACELGQLKAQLRLAYASPPPPRRRGAAKARRLLAGNRRGLCAGWSSGWSAAGCCTPMRPGWVPGPIASWCSTPTAVARRSSARRQRRDPHRVPPDQSRPDRGRRTARRGRGHAGGLPVRRTRPLRIEVVGHSEGLDLLRERLSQHKERIHQLAGRYSNLTFVACQNTIDRLKVEQRYRGEIDTRCRSHRLRCQSCRQTTKTGLVVHPRLTLTTNELPQSSKQSSKQEREMKKLTSIVLAGLVGLLAWTGAAVCSTGRHQAEGGLPRQW